MSRWFRHYAGMCSDPKFGGIARRAKVSRDRVVFVFAFILETASETNDGGAFAWDADAVADLLNCDTDEIERVHAELFAAGLVVDGQVVKWASRQYEDRTNAERQARYKEKKRAGNAPVTECERVTNAPHRQSTETEAETKEDANASSARGPVSDFRKGIMAAFHAAGSTAFPDTSRAAIWLENGWKPSVCLAVISEVLSRNKTISALKYFEQAIADAHLAPVGKPAAPRFGAPQAVGIKPHVRESLVWVEEGSDGWAAWKRAKPGYVHSQLEERTENGKTLVGAYLPSAQPVKQGEAA